MLEYYIIIFTLKLQCSYWRAAECCLIFGVDGMDGKESFSMLEGDLGENLDQCTIMNPCQCSETKRYIGLI